MDYTNYDNPDEFFNIAPSPAKFRLTRSGYVDEVSGEMAYNYTISCRLSPTTLLAVNS
jgi:hypothetical protein